MLLLATSKLRLFRFFTPQLFFNILENFYLSQFHNKMGKKSEKKSQFSVETKIYEKGSFFQVSKCCSFQHVYQNRHLWASKLMVLQDSKSFSSVCATDTIICYFVYIYFVKCVEALFVFKMYTVRARKDQPFE